MHIRCARDDADTTGAVTGAISGAYNGRDAIPARWRDNVERGEEIGAMADAIWRLTVNFSTGVA